MGSLGLLKRSNGSCFGILAVGNGGPCLDGNGLGDEILQVQSLLDLRHIAHHTTAQANQEPAEDKRHQPQAAQAPTSTDATGREETELSADASLSRPHTPLHIPYM